MPAIKDKFDYYLGATGASISVPMPSHATGDLLLVFANYDAGGVTLATATTGWTRLFNQSNGTAHTAACFYKIAASAAEPDIVVTHGGTNDTMTACSISIEDFDATRWVNGTPNAGNYAVSTEAALTRSTMSQISTLRNDTLVFYFLSTTATAGGIHFVEGPVHELNVVDGIAEGLGVGWSFQKTQGNTPATIYYAANATGVGVKATIQVPPPSTGATIIPSYTVSDSSIYLNPNGGTASWDGATKLANTADTRFGTTFTVTGGNITGNDATVALATDIGINSFHAFQGLTNAATVGQISGAQVVMPSARYNVGNRNILAHFRHPTPANNQRLSSLASRRGVWMGMGSGPTNAIDYRIWQVHGVDVPLNAGYIQPIIVNVENTDTIASNGNITNTDVRNYGFWTGGAGNLTQQTCIGPMWAMDTQVIAGGNVTTPTTLPEIVATCATAKERISSLLQGANQMLCYQAIQFGSAATADRIYLDLESTAIEFPSLKNTAKKLVNYNGIINSVGLTYQGVSGDTIIHKNSVIASESDYHWRISANATSAATWDFTGLSLIGAGDVVLRPVVTFTEMGFTNCTTITQNGSTIQNCEFNNSLVSSDNPGLISNSTFISGGTGTGHAIIITTAGTYSFSNNSFSGYAGTPGDNLTPNSGSTDAAIYNNSGGLVTLNVSGGTSPSVRNGAGATTNVETAADVTLTGLIPDSEVRAYLGSSSNPAAATVLAGIESTVTVDSEDATKTIFTFSQSVSGQVGYIQIFHVQYQPVFLDITFGSANRSIPIQQIFDRQYARGTVFAPG